MFIELLLNIDSTMLVKLDALSASLESIKNKVSINPWIPVCSAIVGGLVVWTSQAIERKAKYNQELKKEVVETFTKCEMLLFLIKIILGEYATQKNLRLFWLYSHRAELNKENSNPDFVKKYYDDCTGCAESALKSRLKLGETLAEYYACVSRFKLLSKEKLNLSLVTQLITDTELHDAKEIDTTLSEEEAHETYQRNNANLYKEYLEKYSSLDAINSELSWHCQKINKTQFVWAKKKQRAMVA
jgi:hypothetical protein